MSAERRKKWEMQSCERSKNWVGRGGKGGKSGETDPALTWISSDGRGGLDLANIGCGRGDLSSHIDRRGREQECNRCSYGGGSHPRGSVEARGWAGLSLCGCRSSGTVQADGVREGCGER